MAEQQFNPLLNDRLNTINNVLPPGLVSPRIGASHRTGSTNNSCYLLSHPHIFCILKLSISTTKRSHFSCIQKLLIWSIESTQLSPPLNVHQNNIKITFFFNKKNFKISSKFKKLKFVSNFFSKKIIYDILIYLFSAINIVSYIHNFLSNNTEKQTHSTKTFIVLFKQYVINY
jgi:hypothetical protein